MRSFARPDALSLLPAAMLLLGACAGADPAQSAGLGPAGGAVTLWTDSTELFMEHPPLIVGAPDKFAVHLTDLTDFAPLRSGRVTFTFRPRDGDQPLVVVQEAPRAPGIYGPAPAFTRPGVYDLEILVESPQDHDRIQVPGLEVFASETDAPREAEGSDGGIVFLKEQQWKVPEFRTVFAELGTVSEAFPTTGEVIPAAGRLAQVTAPIAGIIEAAGVAQSPVPGQRVRRGEVLAILTPALGEGGSALAEARAALRESEAEYARAKRLYAAEAVSQRRFSEAESRLTAAREALAAIGSAGSTSEDGRLALTSPITGVVASRAAAPGTRVDAGTGLFVVVDPSVVWLKVNVAAADAPRLGRQGGATFLVPGTERAFTTRRMISAGVVIDSLSRTVPVLYEVVNGDDALRIGMVAEVAVETGRPVHGVVIPAASILEEDGVPIVFVQDEGERFEKRQLVLGGAGDGLVLVRSGVDAGERVVTGAAYQVRLASLSTAVPAHGHEH